MKLFITDRGKAAPFTASVGQLLVATQKAQWTLSELKSYIWNLRTLERQTWPYHDIDVVSTCHPAAFYRRQCETRKSGFAGLIVGAINVGSDH